MMRNDDERGPCHAARRRWTRPRAVGWYARLLLGLLCAGLSSAAGPARAGMHDAETCRRIKTEHDSLGASGIREMLPKGPDWAKSNLTKERLDQARRFLALDEDMRFRCPLGKARPELEAAESEAGATTALQPNEQVPGSKSPSPTAAAGKTARKVKPRTSEKVVDQGSSGGNGTSTASSTSAQTTGQATGGKVKSAARKKAADVEPEPKE